MLILLNFFCIFGFIMFMMIVITITVAITNKMSRRKIRFKRK